MLTTMRRALGSARLAACVAAALAMHGRMAAAQPAPAFSDSPTLPGTPPARHVHAAIEAVNADDAGAVLKFCREHMTPEMFASVPESAHVNFFREFFAETGGVKHHGVRTYDPPRADTEMVVILWAELSEDWRAIVLRVEEEEPHRLTGFSFAPARTPSDVAPEPALSEAEAVRRLEAYIGRLAERDRFAGAALVARGDTVLMEGAWGFADRGLDARNTPDTLFNLGSMNKMITAVCIAQLVEKGTVSFDDPVGKWLSEDWVSPETAEKVRIKHLLSHTSGLGSYFNDEWDRASRALFRELDDWKPIVARDTPGFEPGTRWQYSNTGFLLLGAVIEKASGQDYFEYVREHVYGPAGMARSDSYDVDEPPANMATGYVPERGADGAVRWRTNIYMHVARGGPAGGGYSTVRDLLAFSRALRDGTLVSREMYGALTSAKPEIGSPEYGYGFSVEGGPGNRLVGHSGGFPGISGILDIHEDRGYTVIVLANVGSAPSIAQRASALLPRE